MLSASVFIHPKTLKDSKGAWLSALSHGPQNVRDDTWYSYLVSFKYIQKPLLVSENAGREQSSSAVDLLVRSALDRKWKSNIYEVSVAMEPFIAFSRGRFFVLGLFWRSHCSAVSWSQ